MALLMLAGAGYAYYKNVKEAELKFCLEIDLAGKTAISLLPLELTSGLLKTSLSTITFLNNDYVSISKLLEERAEAIFQANPWIGGWIAKKTPEDELKLWYDPTGQERTPDAFFCFEPGVVPLSTHTKYDQYNDICQDFDVKVRATNFLVGKNTPLWKIRVIPDAVAPDRQFAVVVSMSHVLGDAHTFYKLYAMISTGTIEALNPVRHTQFHDQAVEFMGKEECYYINKSNPGMWGKQDSFEDGRTSSDDPHEILIFTIKNEWLQTRQEELQDATVEQTSIILSHFFQWVEPTVGFVAYPFRESLPVVSDLDAGNYQNPIPFTAADYATPNLIQESMQTGKRSSHDTQPLPKWSLPNTSYAFATDWARFSKNKAFGVQHLPLFDTLDFRCIPRRVSGLVLFQACKTASDDEARQLGAFCIVRKSVATKIIASGIIDETIASL